MNNLGGVLLGLLAGVLGALIWAGIAYYTGYEVGWVAWGVGLMVGGGVLVGSKGEVSTTNGTIAVAITVLCLIAGKFAAVHFTLQDTWSNEFSLDDEEVLISYVADGVMYQWQEEGMDVRWPAGVDPQMASKQSDYDPGVWTAAEEIWAEMLPSERHEFRQQIEADRSEVSEAGFKESFGMYDLLFFGLAMMTAFKLAIGAGSG